MQTVTGREITVPVATRLPIGDYQRLATTAHQRQTSMSSVVREALQQWLRNTPKHYTEGRRQGDDQ